MSANFEAPSVEQLSLENQQSSYFQELIVRGKELVGRSVLALSLATGLFTGESIVDPRPVMADTGGYPDWDKPCVAIRDLQYGEREGAGYWCDDYQWGDSPDQQNSSRYYGYRNCTDWAAWRISALTQVVIPGNWGDAHNWDDAARAAGYHVDNTPEPGDIAVWEGEYGHVAVVESVNSNGSINISEYNKGRDGNYGTRNNVTDANDYIDVNGTGVAASGSVVSSPQFRATSSTEDAPFGGDFNGDGYGDLAIIHKNATDNGANIHVLFGDAGGNMFQYNPTYVKSLPAPLWDFHRMRFAVGKFNNDNYSDLAIVYRQDHGGAAVHVLYGAAGPGMPLQTLTTQRDMPASQGWNWSEMKFVSGDFDGDDRDDIAIGAKRADGGMGIHVLRGAVNGLEVLNNPDTSWRNLPAPTWYWDNIKLAAGPFNGDKNADLAVVYKNSGINVHILNGGTEKFNNASTSLRTLPGPAWNWDQVKLASGQFNDDVYGDIALLHQLADGGIGVHALYGKNGVPFQDTKTAVRSLLNVPDGWNWNNIKFAAGPFQNDNWSDLAMLHLNGVSDADVHVLYGNPGELMFNYNPTRVRKLQTAGAGWNWFLMKTAK